MRIPHGPILDLADRWIDSWRVHRFGGHHLHGVRRLTARGGFLALCWHQDVLMLCGTHRDLRATAMISRSGDGTLLAEFMRRRGVRVAQGSRNHGGRNRGGAAASHALLDRMRAGFPGATAIDGPVGPFKQPQPGIIDLARRAGVPILPVAMRATREFRIRRSWDRMRIPLPRAHVAVCYGAPVVIPPEAPDAAESERRRRHLAAVLHRLAQEAADRVGARDRDPLPADCAWMQAP
ncbi:MAG: hypothetical protein RLZZ127_1401 [Planctomycetota bacterium]|jgi:lysophospholipid acyltransferase (LPLAT)-like uncharacterized protein